MIDVWYELSNNLMTFSVLLLIFVLYSSLMIILWDAVSKAILISINSPYQFFYFWILICSIVPRALYMFISQEWCLLNPACCDDIISWFYVIYVSSWNISVSNILTVRVWVVINLIWFTFGTPFSLISLLKAMDLPVHN